MHLLNTPFQLPPNTYQSHLPASSVLRTMLVGSILLVAYNAFFGSIRWHLSVGTGATSRPAVQDQVSCPQANLTTCVSLCNSEC
jgi:hypothetical protein